MAIFPRTLLAQPAPAAVAAVSLFGFTIVALAVHETSDRQQFHQSYSAPCAPVEEALGARQFWEEPDFVAYAECFQEHHDDRGVIEVAAEGLARYPESQSLHNMKGYHEIGLHEFDVAVKTLEHGVRAVSEQSNGVMENNLAWAYLWVGDGPTDQARAMYQSSLAREPYVCEALHTGLFVEFEMARSSTGIEQAEALRNFQSLRVRYAECVNRDESWNTAVESAGAAVLFTEVEELLGTTWDQRGMDPTMRVTGETLRGQFPSAPVAVLCGEAMPLRDLHSTCVELVQAGIRAR